MKCFSQGLDRQLLAHRHNGSLRGRTGRGAWEEGVPWLCLPDPPSWSEHQCTPESPIHTQPPWEAGLDTPPDRTQGAQDTGDTGWAWPGPSTLKTLVLAIYLDLGVGTALTGYFLLHSSPLSFFLAEAVTKLPRSSASRVQHPHQACASLRIRVTQRWAKH